jgi:D-beta-D-heptose 7-phosphate kinase/D-beta-D-heptose 1-phosphate adenosyltransferase
MSLFTREMAPVHLAPTNRVEVVDPTGAGDTASAVFTLALLAGQFPDRLPSTMLDAAALSNLAAGEVVKRLGAATISAERLRQVAGTWAAG